MQILSLQTKEKVISKAAASPKLVEKDSLAIIMKASQVIRKDILEHGNSWQFSGKFSDYEPPPLTYILCKHIIQGTRRIETNLRNEKICWIEVPVYWHNTWIKHLKQIARSHMSQRIKALILELQKRHHYQLQCHSLFSKRQGLTIGTTVVCLR